MVFNYSLNHGNPQINNGFATRYSFTMAFVVKLWLYK